MTSQT